MIQWKMYVWRSGDAVFRHWFDLELAQEWARRFVRASTLFEQLYCWRRWIEAANLGAYALRHVGVDATAAPLRSITVQLPDGRAGLPFAPAALARALPDSGENRGGFSQPYLQAWPRGIRRPTYVFGVVEEQDAPGRYAAEGNRPFDVRRVAVVSSEGQSTERFERRLVALLRDAGAPQDPSLIARIKGASPAWVTLPLPIVPGLSIAVQWQPVVFDGFYRVVYLDTNEQRLRSSLAFGDLRRDLYPEAWEDPETGLVLPRAEAPLDFIPDLERRREEAAEFARDPWRWLELYTAAIIERNTRTLRLINPALASRADAASRSREVAAAVSAAALTAANAANRDALAGQMNEAADFVGAAPLIGEAAKTVLDALTSFFRAVGMLDLPESQKERILRETIAPIPISGQLSPEPDRARPPTHGVIEPSGWTRTPSPVPSSVAVMAQGSAAPMAPAGPDPTATGAPSPSSPRKPSLVPSLDRNATLTVLGPRTPYRDDTLQLFELGGAPAGDGSNPSNPAGGQQTSGEGSALPVLGAVAVVAAVAAWASSR